MDTLLTVKEVASRLRVHPSAVRRYVTAGELRADRLGRNGPWRISEASLVEFLRLHGSMGDDKATDRPG
jgi:excisionase family DNA binding protein